jgi:hypothetical protein
MACIDRFVDLDPEQLIESRCPHPGERQARLEIAS